MVPWGKLSSNPNLSRSRARVLNCPLAASQKHMCLNRQKVYLSNGSSFPVLWGAILCAASHTPLDSDRPHQMAPIASRLWLFHFSHRFPTQHKYKCQIPSTRTSQRDVCVPICPPSSNSDAPKGIRELHVSSACPSGSESARES